MPSKRSHGEGTLRHRSDGRWELRMVDGYQKDGSPRFKTFYGKTQKEVKLKLKEYQDALISGVQLDTILYFEDWADTWFEGHKDNIAPTTQESYKYCLKMLKEGFYHRPLTVIRPIDIENFLKGMRRDGRSDSYISKARGMLYQIRPCAIKLRDTTDQFIWESPKTGLPCNPTHFRDVFRKSLEEAGDVRLLTPHSCRHTYVSQMQALGVDIQTIQSIVGHADTEMTEHYLHVQESIRQSAIQLFSEAFSA